MKLKVIAHTKKTQSYGPWSVIVEIDRDAIGKLIRDFTPNCPEVGHEYDLTQTFGRLENLEARERSLRDLSKLIKVITTQPEEEKL